MNFQGACLGRLRKLRRVDGGWSYAPGDSSQVEPTCFALLGLASDPTTSPAEVAAGLEALASWQNADGAFRIRQGRTEAVWPTALAAFTLAALNGPRAARCAAADWLLDLAGRPTSDPEQYARDFDIDVRLAGWPWSAGNFSWVEPTAWACLALRASGWGDHPRVREGFQLLLDRSFDEGGINYGNRRVFGRMTEPVPAVTALTLLAFIGQPNHPRIQAARGYLARIADTQRDLENLCWIRIALGHHVTGPDPILSALRTRIEAAYEARHSHPLFPDSPIREALAAMALAVETHQPFAAASPSPSPPVRAGKRPDPSRPRWSQRISSAFRRWGVKALGLLRSVPAETAVHIASADDYDADLTTIVRQQFDSFRSQAPLEGKRVVLKPNLVEYHPDKVINTDPRLIAAVIELCQAEGASEIIVAEGPGHWRNTEYLVEASGLGAVLAKHGVRFVDLNHDEPVRLPNLGRLTGLEYLYFAKTIVEAEVLISLPKLKTHHWAGVTLSCKNLFGTLPGICYGWPKNELHWRGIENSIIDIALTRTPDLAIVDAIVGMEGDGPLNGVPKPLGVIVMGIDPLAVDATCCRLMQIDPQKVPHLALGQVHRLGLLAEPRIRQLGEPIAERAKRFELLNRFADLRAAVAAAHPA